MGSPVVFKGTKALILPQDGLEFKASQRFWLRGSGTPEGAVTAPTGSMYINENTGDLFTKDSGAGNTGWITKEKLSNKGAFNGYPSLDAFGKIPIAQIPASLIGAVIYQGVWNAATNTPALSNGTGTKGFYYVVGTAGTQNLGSGNIIFTINDFVIHNGTAWERLDNVSTLQEVYNNSANPELVTSVANGAINIRGGTGTDTDSNINIENNAGTITAKIQADGTAVFGSSITDASAIFQVNSTTKGMLAPRMTTAQRNAITSPATSLLIFNTTLNDFEYWNGLAWDRISKEGVYIEVNQAAHGFTLGQAVYQDAAGVWQLGIADINAPLTAAQGIATNISVNDFIVVREGRVTVPAHGLTPLGDYFYLDQTTAGVLTGTQPTTGLQVLMGKIVDANTLDVGPVITSLATNFNPLGSYMRRTDGTLHGTVATQTMTFLAAAESAGTDITYVPDAANGDKFVINTTGIYSVSNYQHVGVIARSTGISVGVLNVSDARTLSTTAGHNSCAWTGLINAGEEVWILNDATDADLIGSTANQITIARLA